MAFFFTSILADLSLGVAACFALLYFYMTRKYNCWKERGIHYMKPAPFVGNMWPVFLQKHSIGSYLRHVYEEAPDEPYVGIFALEKPILVIRDLDLVRCVLVKDAQVFLDRTFAPQEEQDPLIAKSLFGMKGKKWRHLRVKLSPTFTSGKMRKMFYLVDECGCQLLELISQEISTGRPVSVKETMARYSTDVIASCAFGVDAQALKDGQCEFRSVMRRVMEQTFLQNLALNLAFLAPSVARALKMTTMDHSILDFVRRTLWDVVDHRRRNGVVHKDFVDLLMQIKDGNEIRAEDSKDVEEIKEDNDLTNIGYKNKTEEENMKLDGDDFVAQAFIFLAAGFETSSTVLNFTLYELALNPYIQDRLRQEIVSVLDKYEGKVSYDCFKEMSYLDMVIAESMRKYPTLPFLERKSSTEYKVSGTNFTIPKETTVMIPVWAIHNDPNLYPLPDKFEPERFTPENKEKIHHFAHLPFGEGPRICIGMRFGQMQVKTALVHVLSSFQVRPCSTTPKPPLVMKNFGGTLIPRDDILLTFTRVAN
ncbi:cytochrome P450 6j1-like [Bacillus rossius redtenbacheri]|uniref:cytochrome P450 6j1-like n=1 Tax=Bacillus rossius redtenbacheri TaxID=93214 RepID=UPI002FDD0006